MAILSESKKNLQLQPENGVDRTVTFLSMAEEGWECQWLATAADSGPTFLELTHGKTRMVAKDAR
jgi:hypothetical protein